MEMKKNLRLHKRFSEQNDQILRCLQNVGHDD